MSALVSGGGNDESNSRGAGDRQSLAASTEEVTLTPALQTRQHEIVKRLLMGTLTSDCGRRVGVGGGR